MQSDTGITNFFFSLIYNYLARPFCLPNYLFYNVQISFGMSHYHENIVYFTLVLHLIHSYRASGAWFQTRVHVRWSIYICSTEAVSINRHMIAVAWQRLPTFLRPSRPWRFRNAAVLFPCQERSRHWKHSRFVTVDACNPYRMDLIKYTHLSEFLGLNAVVV